MSRLFYVCVLYKPYCRSLHTRFVDRNPECLCDSCDVRDLYRDDTFVSFVLSNSIPISDV